MPKPARFFEGFSKEIFRSCRRGPSINKARSSLELLRMDLEPLLQRHLNSQLNGIVTRPKTQGTNEFVNWATLMFTNAPLADKAGPHQGKPLGAHALTQLSVNISCEEIAAGLCIKKFDDRKQLRNVLEKEKNEKLFDEIVHTLSGREWTIWEKGEGWLPNNPKYYSDKELRIELLNPKLYWINAIFEKDLPLVNTHGITNEIFGVFSELFNIYALSLNLELISQPPPYRKPPKFEPPLFDEPEIHISSDEEIMIKTANILSNVGNNKSPKMVSSPERNDNYSISRKVLPMNAVRKTLLGNDGKLRSFYIDNCFVEKDLQSRIGLFDDFEDFLTKITKAMGVRENLIQIV